MDNQDNIFRFGISRQTRLLLKVVQVVFFNSSKQLFLQLKGVFNTIQF